MTTIYGLKTIRRWIRCRNQYEVIMEDLFAFGSWYAKLLAYPLDKHIINIICIGTMVLAPFTVLRNWG